MRFYSRFFVLLMVLLFCSCADNTSAPVGLYVPPTPVVPTATPTVPAPTATPTVAVGMLDCVDYAQLQWGSEAGQLGHCDESVENGVFGRPYSPQVDEQGNLFIFDRVNYRIVEFSEGVVSQTISTPWAYGPRDPCDYSARGWPNIAVSKERVFLLFPTGRKEREVDRIAVFSSEGEEKESLDLEPYYPLHSIYMNTLISDREGGLYVLLPPAGVVHFDIEGRPEFYYMGSENLLKYEGFMVGWDRNLYIYNAESDNLVNWGPDRRTFEHRVEAPGSVGGMIESTGIVSPTYTRLFGVDVAGRLYVRTYTGEGEPLLARFSPTWAVEQIVRVPEGIYPDQLGPDGSLYDLVYDPKDFSVQPRIVKCAFPER